MLDALHNTAAKLGWIRPVVILPGLAALGYAVYLAIVPDPSSTSQFFIPSLLIFFWCLLIYCLISVFQQDHPVVDTQASFFRRLTTKVRRAIRTILAFAFLVLTVSLVIVSFKLLTTGLG